MSFVKSFAAGRVGAVNRGRMTGKQREEQVLEVAYAVFAERGFAQTSMVTIASGAGVTKPILYAHFGSKEGLFAACVTHLNQPMLRRVRAAADPSLPPDGQLWAGILEQLRFIDEHRAEWRAFVSEAGAQGGLPGATLARERERVIDLLTDLVEQAVRTGGGPMPPPQELAAFAHMLQGIVERIANWWEHHPAEAVEAVALRAMNMAWQGFGDLAEGRAWLPPAPATGS